MIAPKSMNQEISIKVTIAGRMYPLSIKPAEEENVMLAAKRVNESMNSLQEGYSVHDKQDLLAMTALQLAARGLEKEQEFKSMENSFSTHISELDTLISSHLSAC